MITVIGNLKGGTGKSTVVFNLALWRMNQGENVTVCDLDPQATLRDAAEVRTEEAYTPTLTVLGKLPTKVSGDLMVDVGMWDTPAMRRALARADRILIPVAPSQADVWSTQRFLEIVAESIPKNRRPKKLAFISRADTHPGSRENDESIEALRQIRGLTVLNARLAQRIAFRRSFSEGLGVFELEAAGKAAHEVAGLANEVFGTRR